MGGSSRDRREPGTPGFWRQHPHGRSVAKDGARPLHAWWKIALEGLVVGVVTGLVGVGGGFLIVPALALLGGLPMHMAIGTSLSIMALKSFVGFAEYLHVLGDLNLGIDWRIVLLFTAIGVGGSWLGGRVAARVPQRALQRTFAVFLAAVGTFIVWDNSARVVRSFWVASARRDQFRELHLEQP